MKSVSTSYDNPPILQSVYLILNSQNINTSKLDDKPLDTIFLKNLLSEDSDVLTDNNINMNLEKWDGHGRKELNDNNYYTSITINLCCYLVDNNKNEFITIASDSGLTFSGQMLAVEAASMMNAVGLNIYQLCILLRILRNKLGTKMFELENMMNSLSGDMIIPKFSEYNYCHETGTKPELILFWVRDTVAVFKKEIHILIHSDQIDLSDINKIDIVVGGDHG